MCIRDSTWSFAGGGFRGLLGSGGDAWAGTGTLAADGLSMALSTTAYAPYRMIVIAFEEGETVVEPVGPIADFTAEFESEVELERVTVWFDSSISNGNGEEILSYAWQFGDGATSTEANPFHVYQGVGEYTVTLTVTTAAGSDSKTKAGFVTIGQAIYPDELIGMSPPATSGGHTGNAFSAAYDHTHFIAGPWVSLEALTTAAEVQAFVDSPGDGLHARMAWDLSLIHISITWRAGRGCGRARKTSSSTSRGSLSRPRRCARPFCTAIWSRGRRRDPTRLT